MAEIDDFMNLVKGLVDDATATSDPLSLNDAKAVEESISFVQEFQYACSQYVMDNVSSLQGMCCESHLIRQHTANWNAFAMALDWELISKHYKNLANYLERSKQQDDTTETP